jgi:hypothetical protein
MSRRQLAAYAVLVIWAVVVGMHVRREYFQPLATQLAAGARLLEAGSHFYVVRMGDAAIGVSSMRLDTTATGFVLEDMTTLDVPALGALQRAVTNTRIDLGPALELLGFMFRLESSVGDYLVRGTAGPDSVLAIVLEAGGAPSHSSVRMGDGLLLDAAVPVRMAAAGALVPGRTVNARVFDPSTLEPRMATIRVVARSLEEVVDTAIYDAARGEWSVGAVDTIPVWELEQTFAGVTLTTWVDGDGLMVRAETPLGFTIQRTAFELAQQEWQRGRADPALAAGYGALIEGTAIASNVDLGRVVERPRLEVRLGGVELTGFDLSGGRQRMQGDTLIVTREPTEQLRGGYTLPYRGTDVPEEWLAPAPLVQSADPRIVAAARRIVGDTRDPAVAALRLNDWVYRNVRKEIALSIPSALQVLDELSGDCNEHTVLYVALARAVGLPARTAVGLVHIRGRFYYHAWPEVWLGERWIALDPTLGQAPADASHLRFLIGGLARQVELIRLIGNLQLEVL